MIEDQAIAPERYELHTESRFVLDRRDFFATLASGLVVLLRLAPAEAQESGRPGGREALPDDVGAWLHLAPDGIVTVYTGKVEVGQGIRTSLAQEVAEELRVPLVSIQMVMGDTQQTPFDMGTFGSRSTPDMGTRLRRVAAAARQALLDLAAAQWNLPVSSLEASDGFVRQVGGGHSAQYGELAGGRRLTHVVDESIPLEPPANWHIAGKPAHRTEGIEIVTGKRRYASDQSLPGMLHGKVLRPPAFGAELESVDTTAARALPDVVVVQDGNFVGAAAPSEERAAHAVSLMRPRWRQSPQPSDREIFDYLKAHPAADEGFGGPLEHKTGDAAAALANADVKLQRTYTVAYIAHVPLEPRAALAQWQDGKLTVWTGTQRPFGVRTELAGTFGLPEAQVRVMMPAAGSGYGGKHTGECAVEAARLAKAAGKPVKLVWTRAEELTWAYFRPAGVIDASAGAGKDGKLTAWQFTNINSGAAGIQSPYATPNSEIRFQPSQSPLRQGSYRALAATANHFARETLIDEIAAALKRDPAEFRRGNLADDRVKAVLDAAAKAIDWGAKPAPNEGFGIACGAEKGSVFASAARVRVDPVNGRLTISQFVTAFECGAIVNPDNLTNQVEGAAVMGLGGALFEAMRFDDGKILNSQLSLYRVPRFDDLPPIQVVLIDRKDIAPAGAGETPIICVAPAIGNAIFASCGVRIRSMPLIPEGRVPLA